MRGSGPHEGRGVFLWEEWVEVSGSEWGGAPASVWRHSSWSGHYRDTLSKTCPLEEEMATHSSTLFFFFISIFIIIIFYFFYFFICSEFCHTLK